MFAAKPRVNLALDTLLLVLFLVALISGLLLEYSYAHGGGGGGGGGRGARAAAAMTEQTSGVSEILGLDRAAMSGIHLYSALAGAGLVGLHLVFHLKWISCQLRRLSRAPRPAQAPPDPHARAAQRHNP